MASRNQRNNRQRSPSPPPPLPSSLVANIRPPQPINVHGDRVEEWTLFDQQFTWFSAATSLTAQPEQVQIAVFMSSIGADAVKEFNTLKLSQTELASLQSIRAALKNRFAPKTNYRFERYQFNKLMQEECEKFDKFLTRVMVRAKKCQFKDLQDDLIVDRLIFGIRDDHLRAKLLDLDPLSLQKAIDLCRNAEACQEQVKVVIADTQQKCSSTSSVDAAQAPSKNALDIPPPKQIPCRNCGRLHPWRQCPAFGQTCSKCNKQNHFAAVCRSYPEQKPSSQYKPSYSQRRNVFKQPQPQVTEVQESFDQYMPGPTVCELSTDVSNLSVGDTLYVNSIELSVHSSSTTNDDAWFEELCLPNHKTVRLKLDTGAQCNVLPQSVAVQLRAELQPSTVRRIVSYSDGSFQLAVLGEMTIKARFLSRKFNVFDLTFLVVAEEVSPILGLKSCIVCGFIKRIYETEDLTWASIKTKFASLFSGLGTVKNFIYDIVLVDQPKLPICPARRIPFCLQPLVKAELDLMEKLKDIPNVEVSMDDILIHASSEADLQSSTCTVLRRIQDSGFKLNPQKCIFGVTRVKFLGHIFSDTGLCPDPSKIEDSYSGFVDYKHLTSLSTAAVISTLKYWFSVHGIPDFVDSDGGPQFGSAEFATFSRNWQFQHRVSSPHYPKSNGLAERNVATVKNLLLKCAKDGTDINLALLNWRNTPRSSTLPSPNQRLMSRQTRTLLPMQPSLLLPKVAPNIPQALLEARTKQKSYADRVASPQTPFYQGDVVFLQEGDRNWIKGRILDVLPEPRSYRVETESGKILRRNSSFLRKTQLPFVPTPPLAISSTPPPVPDSHQPPQRPKRVIRPPQRLDL